MLTITKSTTLTGAIIFENITAVSMFATKSQKGDVNININIQSETLYQANKAEADKNIEEFKRAVEEL